MDKLEALGVNGELLSAGARLALNWVCGNGIPASEAIKALNV
jgi:hypothetical protein